MSDYLVSYNGILLQQAVPGASVLDVVVQPLPISISRIERKMDSGSRYVRKRIAERSVTIEVELPFNPEVGAYAHNVSMLRSWAESNEELSLELPDYPSKKLECVLTGISDISIKDWKKPVKLTFTAFEEPRFTSIDESTAEIGTQFEILGDAEARPTISHTVTSQLVKPEWLIDGLQHIAFLGTYTYGTIVIDLQKGYVTRNGSSIMTNLVQSSRFVGLGKGSHIISGPAGGTLSWHERWND